MTMMLCLLAVVSAIPWVGAVAASPALHFNCTGNDSAAVIESNKEQSLQEMCGSTLPVIYDPTKSAGTTLGPTSTLQIYFSGSGESSSRVYLFNFAIGDITDTWSPAGTDVRKKINKQQCGTGEITAEVIDNGNVVDISIERAVMKCNNSDSDAKLDVVFTTQSLTLPTQSFRDVIKYLITNHILTKIDLTMLTGALPSVTGETLHWVFVYLRQRYSATFSKDNCDVPDYKLGDVIAGTANFSIGINAGMHLDIIPHLIGNPIVTTPGMCGPMELVVMFDALKTDYDADECNNFYRMDVDVECTSNIPPTLSTDMCHVVGNPIASTQVWAKYYDRLYTYEAWDGSWHEISDWDKPHTLFGMSRVAFVQNFLKKLYRSHDQGICRYVKNGNPVNTITDDIIDITISPPSLNLKVETAIAKIKSTTTSDMSEAEKAIQDIISDVSNNQADDISDGPAHTLNILKEFKRTQNWHALSALPISKNMTGIIFAPFFKGLASYLQHDLMNQHASRIVLRMINVTLKYMKDTTDFDKIVLMKLMKVKRELQEMIDTSSMTLHVDCPFGKKLPLAVEILNELANGADGDFGEMLDETSPRNCHQQLMPLYMRSGGKFVQSKDIAKRMHQQNAMHPIPKACVQHPFDNPGSPIRFTNMTKDGTILIGSRSPLSGMLVWKSIARCRCDDCMSGYASHSTPMWTTPTMTHSSTTNRP